MASRKYKTNFTDISVNICISEHTVGKKYSAVNLFTDISVSILYFTDIFVVNLFTDIFVVIL